MNHLHSAFQYEAFRRAADQVLPGRNWRKFTRKHLILLFMIDHLQKELGGKDVPLQVITVFANYVDCWDFESDNIKLGLTEPKRVAGILTMLEPPCRRQPHGLSLLERVKKRYGQRRRGMPVAQYRIGPLGRAFIDTYERTFDKIAATVPNKKKIQEIYEEESQDHRDPTYNEPTWYK